MDKVSQKILQDLRNFSIKLTALVDAKKKKNYTLSNKNLIK